MSNKTSLGSVIRVGVCPSKAKSSIPRVSSGSILSSKSRDLSLSISARRLSGIIGTTDVGQLIADSVGDDVGVQRLLLSLVDLGIDGLEGELCGLSAVESCFELYGWGAGSKVKTGDR